MSVLDLNTRRRFTDLNQLHFSFPLGSYSCELLGWGFLGERWWRNYLHVHSFYEICCAFDGAGIFRINDVEYPVRAGDVFVAKPAESHEIISSESAPLGIYFWSYVLSPQGGVAAHAIDEATQSIDALLHAFSHSRRWVSQHGSANMLTTCQWLTEEITLRAPGYQHNLEGLIGKLIIDTARAVVPPTAPTALTRTEGINLTSTSNPRLIRQITQYLRDNFNRPLQIRDVAAQVHLSERHVSRLFQQATGQTLKDHVQELRIEAASQYLLSTDDAITTIGEMIGLPDVQHFTTVFKRHTGLTPARFRRQRGTRFADPHGPRHVE